VPGQRKSLITDRRDSRTLEHLRTEGRLDRNGLAILLDLSNPQLAYLSLRRLAAAGRVRRVLGPRGESLWELTPGGEGNGAHTGP